MHNRPTTEERLGLSSSQSIVRYFLILMTLIYIGLGVYLWLAPATALNLSLTVRRLLGGVFVFYGIIRFVRTYRQHFQRSAPSRHDRIR